MIVGHQRIIKFLDNSLERGNFSHTYLFCGPEHLGKFLVAKEFCRKITGSKNEINPDIIVVSPEIEEKRGISRQKDISISQIKEMQRQISLSAYSGKYKTVIVDDAEKLNRSSQNALLKTLEDPPAKTVLFIITKDKSRLLPTIISRCQSIQFNLVSQKLIEKIVSDGEKNKAEIIFWSLGRPGMAKILLENFKELDFLKEAEVELENLFSGNLSEKFELAEKMSKNESNALKKLNLWLVILRNQLLDREEGIPQKALQISEKIIESIKTITETNANSRLVLENLFLVF